MKTIKPKQFAELYEGKYILYINEMYNYVDNADKLVKCRLYYVNENGAFKLKQTHRQIVKDISEFRTGHEILDKHIDMGNFVTTKPTHKKDVTRQLFEFNTIN